MKVIPAIDLMNGQVVRLYKGDPNQKTVYSDDPISIIKKWEDAGADMIHLVDLDATLGLGSNFELIKKIVFFNYCRNFNTIIRFGCNYIIKCWFCTIRVNKINPGIICNVF